MSLKKFIAAFAGLVLLALCTATAGATDKAETAEASENEVITANDTVTEESTEGGDTDSTEKIGDTESEKAVIPERISITHDAKTVLEDGRIVSFKGDSFKLYAFDENGNETPVVWKNNSYGGVEIDSETGTVSITSDVYGSTSYLYFTATSVLDESVSEKITIQMTGFKLSDYQKNYTVTLSEDGQSAKTASVSGGISGHNVWTYSIPEGTGALSGEAGNGGTLKFDVYRPGRITYGFTLDINDDMGDTGSITVCGVALEDEEGNRGKVYLSMKKDAPAPTLGLVAFTEEGRTVASFESSDETVASVSEDGLVTATGIGSAIIYAVDNEGAKGGIKVVVESEETPYFESLEFMTTAFTSGTWVKGETFRPTLLEYSLPIRYYSTSTLTLQGTTIYDTERYGAVACYTDINGDERRIQINSGASTSLPDQPFGESVLTIFVYEKENEENATVYTFKVSRPRDTSKALKNTSGIAILPTGRDISSVALGGVKEATVQRLDADGNVTSGTGVSSSVRSYRSFLYDDAESFRVNLTASTGYAHIRYSVGGEEWTELAAGGGITDEIDFGDNDAVLLLVRVLDDSAYSANAAEGKDGFSDAEYVEYTLRIDKVTAEEPRIVTAEAVGDWYPAFSGDAGTYRIVIENGSEAPILSFTAGSGCSVKIGSSEAELDGDGVYTLELRSSATNVVVTSESGDFSSTYSFQYKEKSALDVPDRVVDYLAIGSQYTNSVQYGGYPELVLGGSVKSLGNFGGYITLYYDEPLRDDPNNKYGLDLYVVGNSQEKNIDSMAELGQVYVSEDNEVWYALAGSEHYEDKAIWDYTITYKRGEDGKAYWSDNYGNSIDYAAKAWPLPAVYYMNGVAESDEYSFTGVLFESQKGNITGDGTNGSFAAGARFGYADYYASNISGKAVKDVNSYTESPSGANGFDLLWAVDGNGYPVDVSDKEFHYVRIATASNIYAGSFMEKSTEVSYVVRTTAQKEAVGKTSEPSGVTVSDGVKKLDIAFEDDKTVYEADVGDMKYISVSVNGTSEDDNIYVNNQRIAHGKSAVGFKVTRDRETLIRIIVQNGDCEPRLYLLCLNGDAEESTSLIEGIRIDVGGDIRETSAKSDASYSARVGHRISEITLLPITAPDITVTADGKPITEAIALSYGKNSIEIRAENGKGEVQEAVLTVTRDSAPSSSDKTVKVSIAIYGDEKHGEGDIHTYRKNKSELPVWVEKTSYTVPKGSAVVDVLELCCEASGISVTNADGNYISELGGLWEFDNGPRSGWMYTVNGDYPDLGIAERTVKNGDRIVFHYTDDYTLERASDGFKSSGTTSIGTITESHTVRFTVGANAQVNSVRVKDGSTVAVLDDPEMEGFVFEGWYTDGELTEKYDFERAVTGNITLYAKFVVKEEAETEKAENGEKSEDSEKNDGISDSAEEEKPSASFDDTEDDAWYAEAVKYVVGKGLMNGVSENEFDPDGKLSRGMLVTVLYRLDTKSSTPTKGEKAHSFSDIPNGEWYSEAVEWACGLGITDGVSDTEFAPDADISREALATMLFRYASIKGAGPDKTYDLSAFDDVGAVSSWARDGIEWAVACGIINGTSANTLSPDGTATRAQTAAMLTRLMKVFGE